MAYQSTTATGTGDVLDKIRLFAIAQGWTENRWRDSPETAFGKELCISHADAGYFNLSHSKTYYSGDTQAINDIELNASSGFDSTKKTNEQADRSASSRCSLFGAYGDTKTRTVYLFGTTQCIYVVQELETNLFVHLCFGGIDKAWSYTGGQFVAATWWDWNYTPRRTRRLNDLTAISPFIAPAFTCGYNFSKSVYGTSLRCDFADPAGVNWHNTHVMSSYDRTHSLRKDDGFLAGGYPAQRKYNWYCPYGDLTLCLPQSMPALSPLLPIVPAIIINNNTYLPGQWPDVRYVDLTFISPKQEITLGSDTWMCFPLIAKHAGAQPTGVYDFTSETFGIAYKK